MLSKKFERAFKTCGNKYKKYAPKEKYATKATSHSHKESNEVVVYYECKKSGLIKPNCLKLKKKRSRMDKGKKAMTTTWNSSDDSSSEKFKLALMSQHLLHGT